MRRRFTWDWGFRALCLSSLIVGLVALGAIVAPLFVRGYTAFLTTELRVTPFNQKEVLPFVSWGIKRQRPDLVPPKTERSAWLLANDEVDSFYKGLQGLVTYSSQRVSPETEGLLQNLANQGGMRLAFNWRLITQADKTLPEMAGLWGALCGSVLTLLVAMTLAVPLGVSSAIYLEELAPHRWWTHWIDLKLTNMASVPSVLFGLLGFLVFDTLLGLPRPSPLMGGLTIGCMAAPLLMVTTRLALQGVPKAIRLSAQALGASHAEVIAHHVIPMALPQMVTSGLLVISRALGETAPLLLIGMVAFVGTAPEGITDPATTLPAQIFLWAKNPEWGFLSKTSGGILGLFFLLSLFNGLAFWLRRYFQRNP